MSAIELSEQKKERIGGAKSADYILRRMGPRLSTGNLNSSNYLGSSRQRHIGRIGGITIKFTDISVSHLVLGTGSARQRHQGHACRVVLHISVPMPTRS